VNPGNGTVGVGAKMEEGAEAVIPHAMRVVLPPVLTAAFVGACLALSHVGALVSSGLTPM